MTRIYAPQDHNWTHKSYPRTLREAFPMDHDLYIYSVPEIDLEDQIVILGCLAALVFLCFYFTFSR